MEDYDKDHWKTCCPKVDCRKKNSCGCCGLKFVSIPAVLAAEVVPEKGVFNNAIVRYEDTGEIWIYSAEGVPVLIKDGNNG